MIILNSGALTIVLGVVSGIMTTALLYLAGITFTKVIIPWYQSLIYEGVDLNGSWEFEQPCNDGVRIYKLTLFQNANSINGQMSYIRTKNEGTKAVSYDLFGSVWEGYVSLQMKSKNRSTIAYATALLKVEYGGSALKGPHCFRNFRNDQVSTIDLQYERAESATKIS